MSARLWILAAAALLPGCKPAPPAAGPQACAPSSGPLPPDASAAVLAGEFRIRLVATSGPRRDSSADGTLSLAGRAAEPEPGASGASRYVLVGSGELRLEEVGAAPADVASRDPVRPGVVVFDLPSGILLRLGAEANRQDVTRIEGASTALRVREVRADGFAGEWTSMAPLPVAEGYFCAWRTGTEGS